MVLSIVCFAVVNSHFQRKLIINNGAHLSVHFFHCFENNYYFQSFQLFYTFAASLGIYQNYSNNVYPLFL